MTPLHLAVERNHIDTAKCLVEQGTDINVKDDNKVCIWDVATIDSSLVENKIFVTSSFEAFGIANGWLA